MSDVHPMLPAIYVIQQEHQEFNRELYEALEDAGFDEIAIITTEELVARLRTPRPEERASCYLLNPFGAATLDPWNDVWDLRNHHLIPVMLYIDPDTPRMYAEMYSRLKQLYKVATHPFDSAQIRREILELVESYTLAADRFSSSPWLAAGSNGLDEGILIIDGDRKIRFANLAAERLLETSVVRLYSSEIDDILTLENIVRSEQRIGGMGMVERADLRLHDGSSIPVEVQQNSIFDLAQRRIGTVVMIRDERKSVQFAATMREANQQEELHARARSEFISNMSHELRTPLNSILGMADLALELSENGEQQEFLSLLKSSTRNLSNLVTTILDYAKLEARNLTLEYERFHLRSLVEQSLRPLISRAQGKNLRFYLELQPGMRSIYRGDKGRIAQILENLVQNAVKFTKTGYIRCSISEKEAPDATTLTEIRQPVELIISVEDSGIGIAEDEIPRIFEPFYQLDATATRNYGGTGLGLSIAKRLALRMGGDISVSSEPGEGSAFVAKIIVNREESDLLYLNKKLVGEQVISDRIPAYLKEELGALQFHFVSEDTLWLANAARWLDFIGLTWRHHRSPNEVTRLQPELFESLVIIYDSRASYLEELGDFFVLHANRSNARCTHLVASPTTSAKNRRWGGGLIRTEYIPDPLSIADILLPAMRRLQPAEAQTVDGSEEPLAIRSVYLVAAQADGGILPPVIENLCAQLTGRNIEVRTFMDFASLEDADIPSVDVIVTFDQSIGPGGIVSGDESIHRFDQAVQRHRETTGHSCPAMAYLDGAAPADYLAEREERYRERGIATLRIIDFSGASLLDTLERFAPRLIARASREHELRRETHDEMLSRIHREAVEKRYEDLQKTTQEYRQYYKQEGEQQLANDLFRINLAARRADSVTIFDILNNIRKDIERKSNI
jgi:signal transduction histidine kinase